MVGGVVSEWRNRHYSIFFFLPRVCSEINCVVNKIQGLAVGLGEGHPVPY